MRISDWSSDVCSSDLVLDAPESVNAIVQALAHLGKGNIDADVIGRFAARLDDAGTRALVAARSAMPGWMGDIVLKIQASRRDRRSEEHTSELQSLMRTSYAVFCLNKKKK